MTYIQHALLKEMAAQGIEAVCLARIAWFHPEDIIQNEGLDLKIWCSLTTSEEDNQCETVATTKRPILAI
jgi:hypothetical protein